VNAPSAYSAGEVDGLGTKADDIALEIEEAIVSGELEPGEVLRQDKLS
jgi:DNA-binding GntR family transcriptional regulator